MDGSDGMKPGRRFQPRDASGRRAAAFTDEPDAERPAPVSPRRGWFDRRGLLLAGCAVEPVVEEGGEGPRLVSLSIRRFLVDGAHAVVDVGGACSWIAEGGAADRPSGGPERARGLCDAEAACLVHDAEFVVAYEARRMRGPIEDRLPGLAGRPWICAAADVDWSRFAIEPGSLRSMSLQHGRLLDAGRPDDRILGLLHLLDRRGSDGRTALRAAMATGCRGTALIEVPPVPPERERPLAAAGYARRVGTGVWWREIDADRIEGEIEWLLWDICPGADRPTARRLDWRSRYLAG